MPTFVVPRIGVRDGAQMASVLGVADLAVLDVDASGRPYYRAADIGDVDGAVVEGELVDRDGVALVDRDLVQLVER